MRVYDMSRYQRVIAVDEGRITGLFNVSAADRDREVWVKAHDVVIWDEGHYSGRCFYSADLTGSVEDGVAKLSKHMIASNRLADVEDVWDDMLTVLVAVVDKFWETAPVTEEGNHE